MARLPVKPQATPIQPLITLPALPNASVGQPYRAPFADARVTDVQCPPQSGLVWQDGILHGTPVQAGEILLHVCVNHSGQTHRIPHRLHVNPDPKSLWKILPTDPNAPFYKTDHAAERLQSAHGTLLAARVRGRSHAHTGAFCDDDFRLAIHQASGAHLIAVADGAGSAAYSRHGAELAVSVAIACILDKLNDPDKHGRLPHADDAQVQPILHNLFHHAAYAALQAHQHALASHPIITDSKALACTLLLALTLPVADGWLTAAYWIGDGAAAARIDGTWQLLGSPDSGTYSGETQFLSPAMLDTHELAARTAHLRSRHAPLLVLMTDGISDPKFDTDANLRKHDHWQTLWQEWQSALAAPDPERALQDWLHFWSPGNHDDRTLALFIPETPHG